MERIRLQKLSDAIAIDAIDQNVEVIRTPSSLGVLWGILAYPNTVDSPKGYGKATTYFVKMIASPLWIPHGKSNKRQQQYFTAPLCVGALSDVYRPQCDPEEITLPGKINKVALEIRC